jgi:hypothetical protein
VTWSIDSAHGNNPVNRRLGAFLFGRVVARTTGGPGEIEAALGSTSHP